MADFLVNLPNLKGTPFNLDYLLYVNDGAFIFENRKDIQSGSQTMYNHFACFSLQMHIGNSTNKSKTEAMYFPTALHKAKQDKNPEDLILNN